MSTDLPMVPDARLPAELPGGGLAPDVAPQLYDDRAEEKRGPGLQRIWAAILRYKWLLVVLGFVGLAGGVVASRFMKPDYVAQATIWISGNNGTDNTGPIEGNALLKSAAWVDLLRSYTVLDYVVAKERLYLTYDVKDRRIFRDFHLADRFLPGKYELTVDETGRNYQLKSATGEVVATVAAGDSIGRQLGFLWAPPRNLEKGRTVHFELSTPRDAARDLGARLGTTLPTQNPNFLRIQLSGEDPAKIASVVNTLSDRFIAVAADLKGAKEKELANILAGQLANSETKLHEAESAYQEFRVNTITLPSDEGVPVAPGLAFTQTPVMNNYFQMKLDKESLRKEREAIERVLVAARDSGVSVDALSAIDAVNKSPELKKALDDLAVQRANLRVALTQFTAEMPTVKKLKSYISDLETKTVPMLARGVEDDLQRQESALDALIGNASGDLKDIPPRAIEESRLQREVSVAANLYTNLQKRYAEAQLAAQSTTPDVRILDRAVVPSSPVSDKRIPAILLGLVGGLGLAVAIAILLDRIDPRVRYPEQVTSDLNLPILGAIPHVKNSGTGLRLEEVAPVLEALRGIRLNLLHAYGAAGPFVVTVSSPGSGDGKSFLTANLGLAFADLGYRTLVIDGDTRRGELHRLLGVDRKPGLMDYLSGRVTREQIVRDTAYPKLWVIGSGTRMQRGPELLGSAAMGQLLVHARKEYEVILVDSPPLGAGVDPFILGTLTGNLMLAFRTGRTDRALAEAKLEVLERLPIRVLGAVLNGVEEKGVYRYYSYLAGYEARGEIEDEADETPQLQGA